MVRVRALRGSPLYKSAPAETPKPKRRNSSDPVPKTAPKAPRSKKAAPKTKKDTREDLILQMSNVLDEVDKIIPDMKSIYWSYPEGKLNKPREKVNDLFRRMNMLIAPSDPMTAQSCFTKALTAEPGAVPSIARPGCFVEWIGYVPVLCFWGGFISRQAELRAADPAEQWITRSGYQSLSRLDPDPKSDVRSLFRLVLAERARAKDFDLYDVDDYGKEKVAERLTTWAWLRAALDKGPVNPIPLPPGFAAVQQSLF